MDHVDGTEIAAEELKAASRLCDVPRAKLTGLRWHVVHLANPSESAIEQALKNGRYELYCPHTIEMRPVPKRLLPPKDRNSPIQKLKRTEVAIFPRYMFVRFDPLDGKWFDLFNLVGIHGVLCFEGTKPQPAPVPDAAIEAFKRLEVGGVIPGKVTVRDMAYAIGEQVRVSDGPFVGLNGWIQTAPDKPLDELDGTERLTVLIALFGGRVPVELEIGDIEKL
jgi:transcription antitermination factor NusG